MVGPARFELATSCTPSKHATRLRHGPNTPEFTIGPNSAILERRGGTGTMASGEAQGIQGSGEKRTCAGCGQPIPSMSKLTTNEGGRPLCLACQIRESQIKKGLRH